MTFCGDIICGITSDGKIVPIRLDSDGKLSIASDAITLTALPAGTNNIGDVDIVTLPSGNLGAQLKAASVCINPATDISDAVYIGDIKFGESLPAGTNLLGSVGVDQTTDGTSNRVVAKISQTAGENHVEVCDSSGNGITSTTNALDVNIKNASIATTPGALSYKGKDRTTTTGAAEELTIPANSTKAILSCAPSSQSYIELNADATTSSPLYIEDPFGPIILDLGSVTKLSVYVVAGNIGAVFFG